MKSICLVLLSGLSLTGCASLSGSKEQYYVCRYDEVWEAAVQSVKDRPAQKQDKEHGLIETGWVEMEGPDRSFGMFQRESFGNRERSRMTIAVKRLNDVVAISVLENRQRWHLKGGITQQATKWWPIEPSEEAEAFVSGRIKSSLNEKGCVAT